MYVDIYSGGRYRRCPDPQRGPQTGGGRGTGRHR